MSDSIDNVVKVIFLPLPCNRRPVEKKNFKSSSKVYNSFDTTNFG